MIFHGIRLTNGKYFFQIDTLILSAKFALILEVKNFSGTLFFDPQFKQMIQTTLNGEERGYPHPIEQANLQAEELKGYQNEELISRLNSLLLLANHLLSSEPLQEIIKLIKKLFIPNI